MGKTQWAIIKTRFPRLPFTQASQIYIFMGTSVSYMYPEIY